MGQIKFFKKPNQKEGVTLVELLVVVAVVSVIATFSITTFPAVLAKSRDNRRIADLKMIASALEQFYSDNNYYPPNTTNLPANLTSNSGSNQWIVNLSESYIKSIPKDPNDPQKYYHYSTPTGHQTYVLWASLERSDNPERVANPNAACQINHPIFPPANTFCIQSP